jgi:hypothetical protein
MKKLNFLQTSQISGGEQFLIATSIVDIERFPTSCIERFFNGTMDSKALVGLTEENLLATLTKGCPFSSNRDADLTLIDLKVI